jgi:hypothetical protein
MSVAELEELEEVKSLIARGGQAGVLTYAEVAIAMAELSLEEPDLEELHGLLQRCEIELVEEIDPATAASLRIERAPEQRARPPGCAGSQAGWDHRRAAAVPEGHRQGTVVDGSGGGWARQADRTW